MQRSGTNYLNNLILLHPDADYPGVVWEDFFLAHTDLLKDYAAKTQARWDKKWITSINQKLGSDALFASLGRGLLSFMESQRNATLPHAISLDGREGIRAKGRLVTATPCVDNLTNIFLLFRDARVIVIVREGRSLVESGVKSFDWDYEEAMRKWARAAKTITEFFAAYSNDSRCLLVKYESLVQRPIEEIQRILDFAGLARDRYDFDAALALGVSGSSELAANKGEIHWKPVQKSNDFNPLSRANHWGQALQARFWYIAASSSQALGYEVDKLTAGKRWLAWNILVDIVFSLELKLAAVSRPLAIFAKNVRRSMLGVRNSKNKLG